MSVPDINWLRLEDQLQQAEALRSHDRAESSGPVDGERVWDGDLDPWAPGFEPWPAPSISGLSNSVGDVGGLQTSPLPAPNQVSRNSDK